MSCLKSSLTSPPTRKSIIVENKLFSKQTIPSTWPEIFSKTFPCSNNSRNKFVELQKATKAASEKCKNRKNVFPGNVFLV